MAVRNKTALRQQIASLLADNTAGEISAADVRSVFDDLVDSLAETIGDNSVTAAQARADAEAHKTEWRSRIEAETVARVINTSADRELAVGDRAATIRLTGSTARAFTTASGIPAGWWARLLNTSSADLTFDVGITSTIAGEGQTATVPAGEAVTVQYLGVSTWAVMTDTAGDAGDGGGGSTPAARENVLRPVARQTSTSGVTSLVLPNDYATYDYLEMIVSDPGASAPNTNTADTVRIETAWLAAQTDADGAKLAVLDTDEAGSRQWLAWTPTTRTLARGAQANTGTNMRIRIQSARLFDEGGGGTGEVADGTLTPAKMDADTAAKQRAFREAFASAHIGSGAALPEAAVSNVGDVWIFPQDVASGLSWRDISDQSTTITSADAGDVGLYLAGRSGWVRVGNILRTPSGLSASQEAKLNRLADNPALNPAVNLSNWGLLGEYTTVAYDATAFAAGTIASGSVMVGPQDASGHHGLLFGPRSIDASAFQLISADTRITGSTGGSANIQGFVRTHEALANGNQRYTLRDAVIGSVSAGDAYTFAMTNPISVRLAELETKATNARTQRESEATTRAAADTALGGRIDTEAADRASADTALGGRIDTAEDGPQRLRPISTWLRADVARTIYVEWRPRVTVASGASISVSVAGTPNNVAAPAGYSANDVVALPIAVTLANAENVNRASATAAGRVPIQIVFGGDVYHTFMSAVQAPRVLQAAVDGADAAGVTSLTLPTNYANWRSLTLGLWIEPSDDITQTTIPTAMLAAQTANREMIVQGNPDTNNDVEATWNPTTRVLAAVRTGSARNSRYIFAELHD